MHTALSVLLLTTLIGAGQGLFLALFTGQLYALPAWVEVQDPDFYALGSLVAVALLVAGLAASLFHLGRPERAWRSATRWMTSWLSREVIVLPVLVALVAGYGVAHYTGYTEPFFMIGETLPVDATLLLGTAGTLASFALFLCTGMIYASVKFLEEWRSPLTVMNFTLLGIASGFMLAAAYSALWGKPDLLVFFGVWAIITTAAGFLTRIAALVRNKRLKHQSNLQTAIGIRHNAIVQTAQGASAGSFNTREFFHHQGTGTLAIVRWGFIMLAFPIPILIIGLAHLLHSTTLPMVAFAVQLLGLLAERWYFFAELKHPQNLYYQGVS